MENKTITRQHRATADRRMRMVEQFRRSGLTRTAFCRQYGVPLPTLGYWLTKAKRALSSSSAGCIQRGQADGTESIDECLGDGSRRPVRADNPLPGGDGSS
jgi:transposase-like protein